MPPEIFRPMLACDADLSKLRFPLLASPKLDGVRAIVRNGIVYSRSNKPIPNAYVQKLFNGYEHFDGELIVGSPTAHDVYRQTVSHVMSHDKEGFDVAFYVFDHVARPLEIYVHRHPFVGPHPYQPPAVPLEQKWIEDLPALIGYEEKCLTLGYEGLILRDPDAPYKMGRSTVKEGYLLKLKRFKDAEAVVIGFEERMKNENEATVSELGRTKRSSHRAGKTGRGDLGALVCKTDEGVEFAIGTGFSDSERSEIWAHQDVYLARRAKFKFFPVGVKEAPRHPVFLGWRDERDT